MSIRQALQSLKQNQARLSMQVGGGGSSDEAAQAALKEFIQRTYSDLATLCWHLGADGDCLQRDAVPASEIIDEVFFEINREAEFAEPRRSQQYSTLNHAQQGIVSGARL